MLTSATKALEVLLRYYTIQVRHSCLLNVNRVTGNVGGEKGSVEFQTEHFIPHTQHTRVVNGFQSVIE